jgi:hypothetical protein
METEELLRSHPIDGAVLMGGCDIQRQRFRSRTPDGRDSVSTQGRLSNGAGSAGHAIQASERSTSLFRGREAAGEARCEALRCVGWFGHGSVRSRNK